MTGGGSAARSRSPFRGRGRARAPTLKHAAPWCRFRQHDEYPSDQWDHSPTPLPDRSVGDKIISRSHLRRTHRSDLSGRPRHERGRQLVRRWYLVAGADRAIPAATERFMAHRAGAHTVVVDDASHLVMLSHPGRVENLIVQAAKATD
ncbi:alpha/beta hydrolase [Streptomyces sp. NPDC055109]